MLYICLHPSPRPGGRGVRGVQRLLPAARAGLAAGAGGLRAPGQGDRGAVAQQHGHPPRVPEPRARAPLLGRLPRLGPGQLRGHTCPGLSNNDYNNDYYLLIIIIISGQKRGGDAGAVSGGRGPVCQGVRPAAGG